MSDQSPAFESPVFPDLEEDLGGEDDLDEDVVAPTAASPGARAGENRISGGRALAVLEHIARSLVDDPDAVEVTASEQRGGVAFSLRVAPPDMGRVIGKRGRIAQSLRAVVRAAGAREGTETSVDIVD